METRADKIIGFFIGFFVWFTRITLILIIPLTIAGYMIDWHESHQKERQEHQQAREERQQERQERQNAFDRQTANETTWQSTKRRLHFWGQVDDAIERATK